MDGVWGVREKGEIKDERQDLGPTQLVNTGGLYCDTEH